MQLRDLTHAHDFPSLELLYAKLTGFRGNPETKPLGEHRKPYVSIRKVSYRAREGYACRYHQTDVVTWWIDASGQETVEVGAWSSLSTNTFAGAYTPNNLRFDFAHEDGYFVFVSSPNKLSLPVGDIRVYEFKSNTCRFVRDSATGAFMPMEEDTSPYTFIDTKSSLMRVALKQTNFYNFTTWLNSVASFEKRPYRTFWYHKTAPEESKAIQVRDADRFFEEHSKLEALANPEHWMHLWAWSNYIVHKNQTSVVMRKEAIIEGLRSDIYQTNKLPPRHTTPWVTLDQHIAQRKVRAKFF